jgi:hypothetical protein
MFQAVLNSDGHPTMDKRRSIVITVHILIGSVASPGVGAAGQWSSSKLCRTHLPAVQTGIAVICTQGSIPAGT